MRRVILASLVLLILPFFGFRAVAQQTKVWGTVRLPNSFYTYTQVEPLFEFSDQFFTYWVGVAEGDYYLFDPFSQIWYPPPVQYLRTKLLFRGVPIEGFVRVWGKDPAYIDGSYFFGVDGVIYKNIRKYRRVGPAGRKHKKLVKSYYVNTLTGELSFWNPRTPQEEEAYRKLLEKAVAEDVFPLWYSAQPKLEEPPSTAPLEEEPSEELPSELQVPDDSNQSGKQESQSTD